MNPAHLPNPIARPDDAEWRAHLESVRKRWTELSARAAVLQRSLRNVLEQVFNEDGILAAEALDQIARDYEIHRRSLPEDSPQWRQLNLKSFLVEPKGIVPQKSEGLVPTWVEPMRLRTALSDGWEEMFDVLKESLHQGPPATHARAVLARRKQRLQEKAGSSLTLAAAALSATEVAAILFDRDDKHADFGSLLDQLCRPLQPVPGAHAATGFPAPGSANPPEPDSPPPPVAGASAGAEDAPAAMPRPTIKDVLLSLLGEHLQAVRERDALSQFWTDETALFRRHRSHPVMPVDVEQPSQRTTKQPWQDPMPGFVPAAAEKGFWELLHERRAAANRDAEQLARADAALTRTAKRIEQQVNTFRETYDQLRIPDASPSARLKAALDAWQEQLLPDSRRILDEAASLQATAEQTLSRQSSSLAGPESP
jgi:hypothetical protein